MKISVVHGEAEELKADERQRFTKKDSKIHTLCLGGIVWGSIGTKIWNWLCLGVGLVVNSSTQEIKQRTFHITVAIIAMQFS